MDYEQLNENQRAAVEADGRPTLVLAGPGSGKTAVLIWRLARIISETPNQHFRVLGLTFTKRAATEMQERARALLSASHQRAVLTTFHSFAAEVLRQHGTHVGIKPDFSVVAQTADRESLLEKVIRNAQEDHPDLDRSEVRLLPLIDNLLEKLVPPDKVKDHIRDPDLGMTLSLLYSGYRSCLIDENALDFATLLCLCHELLNNYPMVATQLRSTYTHVLVDEFQDTSLAQFRFLQKLVGPDPENLFVVADDDQIIYQWNGADPRRLEELQSTYGMRVIQLPTNYRCPANVIDLANSLIEHNHGRAYAKQPLRAAGGTDGERTAVVLREFQTQADEAKWIADAIARVPKADRGDCVVLARTKRLLADALPYFEDAEVDAVLAVRKDDFESAPYRWLMAMLRLAVARGEREHLASATRSFYRLEGVELSVDDVIASASARGGDLLRSFVEEALARGGLAPETRLLLSGAGMELVDSLNYDRFIESAQQWFQTLDTAAVSSQERDFADFSEECEIWSLLESQTKGRYNQAALPLAAFLQELDLSPKVVPIPPGTVRCYTIHNAKGMEFPKVFLMGMAEEVLPSFQAIREGDDSDQMQEERRNCFVGITRTREQLTMTYARNYFGWPKSPSRFLTEMGAQSFLHSD